MSSVDNRIVRMQFDNAQFEAGVMKSMKTIDELNEKLQFKEASKGVSALRVAVSGLEGLSDELVFKTMKGIDKISEYSTSMIGMIKKRIKEDIVDGIVKSIESLPQKAINQIKTGGWARANNIANAQFTVSGLGYSWDKIKAAADYGVTDTAYGLDSAAKAASQLAASGVDFEETLENINGQDLTLMHKALRGISGVAAMTNSSFDEIANIFTKIAGLGRVQQTELSSISIRGINAASTLANYLGVAEQDISELTRKGLIDFETFALAMDDAFGEHAKEANRTFSGSLSNMKAALSRIGAIFSQPIIDKTNTFFVSVTSQIKKFQAALNDSSYYKLSESGLDKIKKKALEAVKAREKLANTDLLNQNAKNAYYESEVKRLKELALGEDLQASLTAGDVEKSSIARFATHFADMWQSVIDAGVSIVDSMDFSWFQNIADGLDKLAQRVKTIFDGIVSYYQGTQEKVSEVTDKLREAVGINLDDWHWINEVAIKGTFGNGIENRFPALAKAMEEAGQAADPERIQGYVNQFAAVGYSWEALGWTQEELIKKQEELSKTSSQRIKELTNEELVYASIATALDVVNETFSNLKVAASSFIGGFKNIGRAIGEIAVQIGSSFLRGFDSVEISQKLIEFSEAFRYLTEALIPSEGLLEGLGIAAEHTGGILSAIISRVIELGTAIFTFAGDLMHGKQQLEEFSGAADMIPLQRTAANIVIVFTNIKKVVTNVFKSVGKVIKSFRTAFKNVFKPSGVTSYIAGFTEGLSDMSEAFVLSDEAVEKLTSGFESVFKVFQKVSSVFGSMFSKLTGFFSKDKGLGQFGASSKAVAKDIVELSDGVVEVSVNADKAEGIFYRLKIIFSNFVTAVKNAPGKIKDFFTQLKNSEGVMALQTSLQKLKITMKDVFDKLMPPANTVIQAFGETAGTTAEETVSKVVTVGSKVAEAISWIVDKITWLVSQLPDWKDAVVDFFITVKEGAITAFDFVSTKITEFGKKFGIDDLFTDLKTTWENASSEGQGILVSIKTFGSELFDATTEALSGVNWDTIGDVSMMTLLCMTLFKFVKLLSAGEGLLNSVASVPKGLGDMFKGIVQLIGNADKYMGKLTNLALFFGVTQSFVSLAGALILLSEVPIEKAENGLKYMEYLAILLMAVAAATSAVGKHTTAFTREAKEVQNATNVLAQVHITLSPLIGAALMIAAVGGVIYILVKAVEELAATVDALNLTDAEVSNIITILGVALGGVLIIMSAMMIFFAIAAKTTVKTKSKAKMGKNVVKAAAETRVELTNIIAAIAGIGIAIAAIAGSVYLLTKAAEVVSNNLSDGAANAQRYLGSLLLIAGIFAGLTVVMGKLIESSKDANPKAVLSAALLIGAIALSMYVILSQVAAVIAMLSVAETLGHGEEAIIGLVTTFAVIPILIGALAFLMKQTYMVDSKAVKNMASVVLAAAVFTMAFAVGMAIIINAFADVPSGNLLPVLTGVALTIGAFVFVLAVLRDMVLDLSKQGDFFKDPKGIMETFGSIAALVLVLGISSSLIASSFAGDDFLTAAGGIVLTVAMFGVVIFAISKFLQSTAYQLGHMDIGTIATIFGMIALVIGSIGVTALLIGAAGKMLENVSLGAIAILMGGVVVSILAIFAMAFLLIKKGSNINTEQITDVFVSIGAALLMIAISVLVFASACERMQSVDFSKMTGILAVMGVLLLVMIALTALGGLAGADTATNFQTVANVFISIGLAMLIFAASVAVLGIGLGKLAEGIGKMSVGIATLAATFKEHWLTVILVVAMIAVIMYLGIKLTKVLNAIIQVVQGVGAGVSSTVKEITKSSNGLFSSIGSKLKESPKKLASWWKNMTPKAKAMVASGIISIVGGIAAATPETLKHVGDIIFKVFDFLISLVPKLVDLLVKLLITLIDGLAETIRNNSAELVRSLYNLLESILELCLDILGGLITMLVGWVMRLFGASEEQVQNFGTKIADGMKGLKISFRGGLAAVDAYAAGMAELNGELHQLAEDSGLVVKQEEKLSKSTTDLTHDLSKIGGINLADLGDNFDITKGLDLGGAGGNVLDQFLGSHSMKDLNYGNTLTDLSHDLTAIGGVDLSNLGDNYSILKDMNLGGAGGNVLDSQFLMGQAGADAYANGFTEEAATTDTLEVDDLTPSEDEWATAGEEDMHAYTNATAATLDSPDARQQISDSVDANFDTVYGAVDDNIPELQEYIGTNVIHAIYSTLVAQGSPELVKVGKIWGQCLRNGINLGQDEVKAASEDLGNAACVGVEGPLKINSPSKRFYADGVYCVQGLVNGLNAKQGEAESAMSGLADQMIASFGDPLNYVSKVASGEIAYDPTIRPVMDMTSVGRTATDVSSMFANQNVSLSGLSGQIAYDMTTLNGSNANVVAELQAMREDMSYMTEEMSNMKIVMDTGALVGSTVGAYDEALGQRQVYRERGN